MKFQTITTSPDVQGGAPVLRGTRFPAAQILSEVADKPDWPLTAIAEDLEINCGVACDFLNELADWIVRDGKHFCSAECDEEEG